MTKEIHKQKVAPKIDFADSEFKFFQMNKNEPLYVFLNSWDAKNLIVIFTNVIQFSYKSGNLMENLYEVLDSTSFLENALRKHKLSENRNFKLFQFYLYEIKDPKIVEKKLIEVYEDIPTHASFHFYQIVNNLDDALFEIIAESFEIFKESKYS